MNMAVHNSPFTTETASNLVLAGKMDKTGKALSRRVVDLQQEYDRLTEDLSLPGKQLAKRHHNDYLSIWKKEAQGYTDAIQYVAIGSWGVINVAQGIAALAGVISTPVMLAAFAASYPACFLGIPKLYIKVVRDYILPPKVDKPLRDNVRSKRNEVEGKLDKAKEKLNTYTAKELHRISSSAVGREYTGSCKAAILQDDDYVNISGVRLEKKEPNNSMDYASWKIPPRYI